ncbi:MAG: hypothetical protein AAF358_26050 [Pseudomonadota bacterium]
MYFTKHESGIRIHQTPWLIVVLAPLAAAYFAITLWDTYRAAEMASPRGLALCTGALVFAWSFGTLRLVSIIHFDRRSQSIRWRRMTLLRREQVEVPFKEIERLALADSEKGRAGLQRLYVRMRSGDELTLLPSFDPALETSLELLSEIRAVLANR